MKTYDVSRLPPMITLGYDGENNWRPIAFDCTALLTGHPNAVVTLWLLPKGETQAFPVALERDDNVVTWTPLSEEMTAEHGQLQIVVQDGTDVGKSRVVDFTVHDSIIPGADHPAETPSWAVQVVEDVTEAAEHYPRIVDGNWYVWDVSEQEWVDTGVAAGGADIDPEDIADAVADYLDEHPITETDPTVPAWAKNPTKPTYTAAEVGALPDSYTPPVQSVNGKSGAVVLDAEDVGALPDDTVIPAAVTEQDVAGWGFTKNTGTYSKPSGGIPASDLAAGVIPDISGKQDAPLIGQAYDSAEPDYLTPYQVVTALETGKDVVVEWHDNDFGTLYFTAWNTSHLGNVTVAVSNTAGTYNNSLILYQFAGNMQTGVWNVVASIVAQISDIPTVPTNVSAFTNDSGYQTAQQVQTAISPLQSKAITDTGGYYTTDTVDGALQEIGAELAGVNTLIGSGVIT